MRGSVSSPWFPWVHATGHAHPFAWNIRRFTAELRRIRPDIVHAHGTEAAYALAAQYSGFPYLISIQGIITEYFKTDPCLRYQIVRHYEQDSVRRSKYFTCRTNFDTGFVRSVNPRARIFTIHEAMSPVYFHNNWEVRDTDRLLYVGSLEKRKGLDILLEALNWCWARARRPCSRSLGAEIKPAIKNCVNACRSPATLSFWVSNQRIRSPGTISIARYSSCRLETRIVRNTLAEAMVSGMPVIATAVGGIPSMVEHG